MKLATRQVSTLLGGALLAQLVGLGASPMLTRLFKPDDFAALALFGAVLAVLAVVAGGRYELAVMLPKDDGDSIGLLALALLLAAGLALAVALLQGLAGEAIAARWHWHRAELWLPLLAPAVLLSCALAALGGWVNRQARYTALAASRLVQALAAAGSSLALGAWGATAGGLVWGSCLGLLLGCGWLAVASWRTPALRQGWRRLGWPVLARVARQHADFPRVNLPHALLDTLQAAVLLSLLGAGWGATALGLYALVQRTVRAPMAMLGASMGQVFQQRAAQCHHAGQPLRPLLIAQWRQLLGWLLPMAAAIATAPWTFALVFGETWREGGQYALILLPWMAMNFLVSPLSQLPLLLGRQRGALVWGLAYQAAMLLPVLAALGLGVGLPQALLAQSICAATVLAGYAVWLLRIGSAAPGLPQASVHG